MTGAMAWPPRAPGTEDGKKMIRRRHFLGCLAVSLAAPLWAWQPATAEDSEDAARVFIETMADKAVAALTKVDVPREERVRRFRSLLHEHFAVNTIGRWVLGRYWRAASEPQREEYLKLFEELIVSTYVDRFTRYSGEDFAVTRTVRNSDRDTLVFSVISRPQGAEPISVGWRVRGHEGQFKIVDVVVEGVSMGQTQRSEFASVIRRNGGTVEGLLRQLRRQLGSDV